MNEVTVADYVPAPVLQDVVVLGASRGVSEGVVPQGVIPEAATPQIEVLNASLASTGAGFDLALVIGGGILVLAIGLLLLVLGTRSLRTR